MDVTARVRNPIFEKYLQKSTSTLRNSDEICTNRMAILGIKTIKPLIYNNSQSFYIGIANLVFLCNARAYCFNAILRRARQPVALSGVSSLDFGRPRGGHFFAEHRRKTALLGRKPSPLHGNGDGRSGNRIGQRGGHPQHIVLQDHKPAMQLIGPLVHV